MATYEQNARALSKIQQLRDAQQPPEYWQDDFDDDHDYPKECYGGYSPGTEECDWCEYADECGG